jgi:cytochrome P450
MTPPSPESTNLFMQMVQPETLRDPYPLYAQLREREPIRMEVGLPGYLFARHQSISEILHDDRFSNDWPRWQRFQRPLTTEEEPIFERIMAFFRLWMQANDAGKHQRIRQLVMNSFTPRNLERLARHVEETSRSLLEAAKAKGPTFDLIADYARPLPEIVIAEIFGLPVESRTEFARCSAAVFSFIGTPDPAPGQLASIERDIDRVRQFLLPIIEDRRKAPRSDVMSELVRGDGPDALTTEEVVVQCALMLAAGHETTTALIGNGFLALLRHPQEFSRLRGDLGLAKAAVDESLRYDGPSQWLPRIASKKFEFRGVPLEEGQMVFLGLAAGNRDERANEDPDAFRLGRRGAKTLSFGGGAHYCLGAMLARMQAETAFRDLASSLKDPELATDAPQFSPNFVMRGLIELPIRHRA